MAQIWAHLATFFVCWAALNALATVQGLTRRQQKDTQTLAIGESEGAERGRARCCAITLQVLSPGRHSKLYFLFAGSPFKQRVTRKDHGAVLGQTGTLLPPVTAAPGQEENNLKKLLGALRSVCGSQAMPVAVAEAVAKVERTPAICTNKTTTLNGSWPVQLNRTLVCAHLISEVILPAVIW